MNLLRVSALLEILLLPAGVFRDLFIILYHNDCHTLRTIHVPVVYKTSKIGYQKFIFNKLSLSELNR